MEVRTIAALGQAIRAARKQQGLTQEALATKAGVSRQWLIGIEKGSNARAEVGLVLRVLGHLDLRMTVQQPSERSRASARRLDEALARHRPQAKAK